MQKALNARDHKRLIDLLARATGSTFSGERDAAVLAAKRFLDQRGARWGDLITPPTGEAAKPRKRTPPQSPPPRPRKRRAPSVAELFATCRQHRACLNDWERLFLGNISAQTWLSKRQYSVLCRIAHAAAARAAA